jgi:Flp pilus assembly protein TadB
LALVRGAGITEGVNALDATPELRLALDVIAITADVGGQAAVPLERTAVVLRQRAADLDDRAVQAAQARTSAHVMTALPVAVLALLAVGDDDVVDALASPAGLVCALCGSVLNVIGWCWMRRIVAVGS